MAYKERTRECHKCGREITGRLPPAKPVQCIYCAIGVSCDQNRQLHEKRGPHYRRWQQGMLNYLKRLEAGG